LENKLQLCLSSQILLRLRHHSDGLVRQSRLIESAALSIREFEPTPVQTALVKRKRENLEYLRMRMRSRSKVDLVQPPPLESDSPPRAIKRMPKRASSLWSRCYIGPALELALSVSRWSAVRLMVEALFGCTFIYNIIYSDMSTLNGTKARFLLLSATLPHTVIKAI
jgi:hypothetical protein